MKLSIITVCLNSRATIEDTILSVQAQTHREIEHIVIDGGSADGTLEILEKYRGRIALIVSESDNGIYDAMNKGIAVAGGEVIGILNADDLYATDGTLEKVCAVFSDSAIDACYGDLAYVHPHDLTRVIRFWKAGVFRRSRLFYGWMPPHPTFFVRKSCYADYGKYRTDLGSSADYELMLRFLLKHQVTPAYIPETLVRMRTGGASNASLKKRLQAHLMDWRSWQVNGLHPYPWTLPLKPLRKIHQWFCRDTAPRPGGCAIIKEKT